MSRTYNFTNENGEELRTELSRGQPTPVHIPTTRGYVIGEELTFTCGSRSNPTFIAKVIVQAEHEWRTPTGRRGQNLIVVQAPTGGNGGTEPSPAT